MHWYCSTKTLKLYNSCYSTWWALIHRLHRFNCSHVIVTDCRSALIQVMAWCRQATSQYLSQCWPRSMSPYGVIRPQWVSLSFEITSLALGQTWGNLINTSHKSTSNNITFTTKQSKTHCAHIQLYYTSKLKMSLSFPNIDIRCLCIFVYVCYISHLGLVSHICVMKNSLHFPSEAYLRRKSLYFPYRSRGRPTKQFQAKVRYTCTCSWTHVYTLMLTTKWLHKVSLPKLSHSRSSLAFSPSLTNSHTPTFPHDRTHAHTYIVQILYVFVYIHVWCVTHFHPSL